MVSVSSTGFGHLFNRAYDTYIINLAQNTVSLRSIFQYLEITKQTATSCSSCSLSFSFPNIKLYPREVASIDFFFLLGMYRFFLTCLRACTIFDLFNKFFHLFFELICVARFGFYTRKQQKQQKTSSLVVLVPPPPHCRLCNFNHEFYWPLLNVRTIWREKILCEIFRIDCVYHHSNEKALNKVNFHHSVN